LYPYAFASLLLCAKIKESGVSQAQCRKQEKGNYLGYSRKGAKEQWDKKNNFA
jgi:hypothetical protein